MKSLFYRYGSICEPDIIAAFQELGITVNEITEEMTNKALAPSQCVKLVSERLQKHPVDFVFSMNFFPAVSEVCNIFHIPYLCWIVDSPVMELYSSAIKNKWNRVFLFDRTLFAEISPLNPDCVFYLPLAVNVKDKDSLIQNASTDVSQKYKSNVSFIGSLYTEKCAYDRLDAADTYLEGYLNGIMEAQLKVYGYYFIEDLLSDTIVNDFISHFNHFYRLPGENTLTDRTTLAQLYIGIKITVMERDLIMTRLSNRFPVTIYTGSDTSAYPKLINKGFAKSLTEMPLIFHESVINLNITAKSIRSGLPQRIWDILGSGGFCLSNYQSEISEYFTPGVHLDTYESPEDLEEKVAYYLAHPAICREIASDGYSLVKEQHNYNVRLTELFATAFHLS